MRNVFWVARTAHLSLPSSLSLVGMLLLLASACTGSVNAPGGVLDTNVEQLPDTQSIEESSSTPLELEFSAKSKVSSMTPEVSSLSSDESILPHPAVTFDTLTGKVTLKLEPVAGKSGPVTVTVTVKLGSRSKQKVFTLNITAVNQSPVIEDFIDQTLSQGSTVSGITFEISDRETPAADLIVSVSSTNQTLLPNANITLGGSGANRTLSLNPVPTQNGSAVIVVTVTDADGNASSEAFNLTVTPAGGGGGGSAPTISNIADQTINEDASTSALAFTVGDVDQPANTLSVSAASSNTTLLPLSGILIAGTGASRTVTLTPAANEFGGPVTVTLTVSDGTLTTDETFTLTVNSVNDAPTISDIANQTIAANANTGSIGFTIGDVETATGTLTVTGTSSNTTLVPNNPANISFGGSNGSRNITITPAANQFGTATITVEVSDGTDTATDTFTVTVTEPNQTNLAFTYPHKNGFKIGESDDQAYTVHGTCGLDWVPVRFSINSGAVTGNTTCSSGEFSYTFDVSALADGTISVATTNGATNVTRTLVKETSYCVGAALTNAPFAGGTGAKADPYNVCTPTQASQIGTPGSGYYYQFKNNLNFTAYGTWSPINPGGYVDGDNFQIKNLTLNSNSGYSGFFTIWSPSQLIVLKNIHLYNITQTSTGGPYIGTLAAQIQGGAPHVIYNCSAHGSISGSDGDEVGGLIGWYASTGSGRIENSFSSVTVSTTASSNKVGGLVGNNEGASIIRSYSTGSVSGGDNTGGLVGQNSTSNSPVSYSFSTGSVSHVNTTKNNLGGLIGYAGTSTAITDSYSFSSVNGGSNVGGFAGANLNASARLYSIGSVSGTGTVGGLVATSASGPTNSYWNTTTSGQGSSAGGTGLTTAQMQVQGNFTGFDFSASGPWQMNSSLSLYPTLKWQSNLGAPTITQIADQTINQDTATSALAITVGDETVAASDLTLSGYSTNTTLVPNNNITFGGSGANRTVTVTPAAGQYGTAWIFVDVSDGSLSDFAYFQITVNQVQTGLAFTYPHKNGFKIGESDDHAYTVHGTCGVNGLDVQFSINSGAVTGSASCASNEFAYTFDVSGLADGTISVATTNGATNVTRTLVKETNFCVGSALTNAPFATVGSTGARNNPHYICTATQLKAIGTAYQADKAFIFKNNIDVSADTQWATLGPISGFWIEGNNFQVKNLTRSDGGGVIGLFGFYGTNNGNPSVLRDLHAYNVNFSSVANGTGPIIAYYDGNSDLWIKNLSAHGQIVSNSHTVGGVIGLIQGGIGSARMRIVEDLYSQVRVTSTNATDVGGLIGRFTNRDGVLPHSYLRRSKFQGTLNCNAGGGIVSSLQGPLGSQLVSNGVINCTGNEAGIALTVTNQVQDTYNKSSSANHGGINSGTLTRFFNTGTTNSGGGVSGSAITATNTFWDTQTSGSATSAVGTGLTTAQLQNSANLTGFDFSATGPWEISAGQYPSLKWETNPESPTISAIADQTLNEDSSSGAIAFTVGDVTTSAGALTLTGISTNPTLVPDANITFGGTGASRTVTITPAANQTGTAWIFVEVNDGSLSEFAYFRVTVNNVDNDAPTISDVANQTINEDADTGALAVTISDPETAAGSLTMSGSSSNQTLIPDGNIVFGGSNGARTVTVTPAANQFGTATITIGVSDGTNTTQDTFTVTVNSLNDAPTISDIANQTTNEDTATGAIAFTIGDIETPAGSLSISVNSDNATIVQNSNIVIGGSGANRTLTITPEPNAFGTVSIDVTIDDGGADVTDTFTVTVTAVNDAPTITAIADQNIASGGTTGALVFTIGDVETDANSLTVTRASSNTTIIPLGNVTLGGTGTSRTVTATGAANQWGTVDITVTVDDGTTTTDEVFQVTVDEPDQTYITFTYPHKDGFKVGESDDNAYTLHGTCGINGAGVELSVNSGAVTGTATCASNEWSHTLNLSGLSDGTITVATTNVAGGANVTRSLVKETSYCVGAALTNAPFAGGTGAKADPYKICTLAQAQNMGANSNNFFELKNNINLTSWSNQAIGKELDGNNFQLKNYTKSSTGDWQDVSLFSMNPSDPIVLRNLHVYNATVSNTHNALCASIILCELGGTGWSRLRNLSVHGSLTGAGGSIVGLSSKDNAIFEELYSSASITSSAQGTAGIIGSGGGTNFLVRNTGYSGTLTSTGDRIGGIVGNLSAGSIQRSYSSGSLSTGTGTFWIGGIIGNGGSGDVVDSYSRATVSGYGLVGGIAGTNASNTRIYFAGSLLDPFSQNSNYAIGASPTNSFYNSTLTTPASNDGSTGLTTAQMQNSANFTGFDFTANGPWEIAAGSFPTLKWQSNLGAPTITQIADQTINEDGNTGALAFTIGDETVAAGSLTLSAYSTNTTLVPNGNITLGGSGASRTVTVTPAANQSGTAWIFVDVSDGSLSDFAYFRVTVNAVNDAPEFTDVISLPDPLTYNPMTPPDTSFVVEDAESGGGGLTVTVTSNNQGCLKDEDLSAPHQGGDSYMLTIANTGGGCSARLTIRANDGTTYTDHVFEINVQ